MAQAATLTQQQLQRVLDYLRTRRHYKRNRTIILLTHYAMLRVGEVAALRYCDILEADGQIKAEAINQSNLRSHCFIRNVVTDLQLTH